MECAIRNRREAVNSRNEFGHWEADLMIFGKEQGSANIAMVVERESRYTVLLRNNDRRSKPIMNQLISHLAYGASVFRPITTIEFSLLVIL